jgi:hypothetical protein
MFDCYEDDLSETSLSVAMPGKSNCVQLAAQSCLALITVIADDVCHHRHFKELSLVQKTLIGSPLCHFAARIPMREFIQPGTEEMSAAALAEALPLAFLAIIAVCLSFCINIPG